MDITPPTPSHRLRRQVIDEVHARPFDLVAAPRRVLLSALAGGNADAEAARAMLADWCTQTGVERPEPAAKFHRARFPYGVLRWESHTEFSTWTWSTPAPSAEVFAWPLTQPPPFAAAFTPPGDFLVGVDLALVSASSAPSDLTALFDTPSLCVATVYGGAARIITDFRQDARGNTRILVIDDGLGEARAGALVQRLLEIETYRTFALLGLPEALRVSPIVSRIEADLVAVTARMRDGASGLARNAALLDSIVALAADLETEAATSGYRFAATRAYDAIVKSRLAAIEEQPSSGYSSWSAFLDRRMGPAMRTCQAVADRQADLSRKLTRAANLLRTRVEVEMQTQNTSLLEAMNQRAQLQLRLQETVEGLSIAAVSYYVLGLLGYLFKGAKDAGLVAFDPAVATAAALPAVVIAVWWTVRRVRRHHASPKEMDRS